MQKLCVFVAVCLLAAPAMANDGLLEKLGLGGIQVVSDAEASQVRGQGFAYANGFVESEIDFDDGSFYFADIDAFQELWLEGISSLTGEMTAAGNLDVDFSDDDNGDYWIYGGEVTVGSATTVSGTVH